MKTFTAIIIGGGIAGTVCAMALQQVGIKAVVYESHTESDEAVGGGITLAPNGVAALDIIECVEIVHRLGAPMDGIVLQSWNGKRLGSFESAPGDEAALLLWRGAFSAAMRAEAKRRGIATITGARFIDARTDGGETVAKFEDGSEARADLLIGADGIHSRVRGVIDPDAARPAYTGLLGYGGTRKNSGLTSTNGTMLMSFGKRAFFGYRVGDDDTAEWFANLPAKVPTSAARLRDRDGTDTLRELHAAFAADRTPAAELIAATDPAALITVGPLEIMPKVRRWSRDGMVIVGDAAHAPSPSSGQGASLAIESAIELARCLRDLPRDEAFRAYERTRRPRVERIIAAAEKTNNSKTTGPVGRAVRDLVLPLAMKFVKPEKQAWQTDYRIDWNSPVAS